MSNPSYLVDTDLMAVLSKTPVPDLAFEVAKYMHSPEIENISASDKPVLPQWYVNIQTVREFFGENVVSAFDFILSKGIKLFPPIKNQQAYRKMLSERLAEIWTDDNPTYYILSQLRSELDMILDQ